MADIETDVILVFPQVVPHRLWICLIFDCDLLRVMYFSILYLLAVRRYVDKSSYFIVWEKQGLIKSFFSKLAIEFRLSWDKLATNLSLWRTQ